MRDTTDHPAAVLRQARLSAGLSLRAAAGRAGTSHATLAAYEGARKSPTVATMLRLLRSYGFATDVQVCPRIREHDGLPRGKELEQVLALAEQFPARTDEPLAFPRFAKR